MEQKEFKPYIKANTVMPEFTTVSVVLGIILAVVFGGANAYLGLRVGMTVSASIPAAVISMGIIRKILKRDSILENNMVQTIASTGESLAAGAIFTLPALFMWADEGVLSVIGIVEIALISICGGMLGVLFMIPLRRALIVKEHGVLAYPEGQACVKVLIAGEEGGNKAKSVTVGFLASAVYKFIADGLKLFPSKVDFTIPKYKGAGIGIDVLPALLGVGYICGAKVSAYLLAGGVLAWLVIMPIIALFGSDLVIFPATMSVSELLLTEGTFGIWSNFVRYIGAGAVAAGGILRLIKTLPLISRTFVDTISEYGKDTSGVLRTERDLSSKTVIFGIIAVVLLMLILPFIKVNILSAIIIVIFGFFFATVSSRMVGLVGSSNNPVSGMAIATLLVSTLILKSSGVTGAAGMESAIIIGTIICIITAISGDTSQDLKTGFLLGATPKKQQIGELIGSVVSAVTIGAILYLLNSAWGFGSEELSAAQATLMKMVVEGVMNGNLPWALVFIGVFIAIVIEILGIPVLPVAIGLYLPIHLSTPIMAGGLIRLWAEKRKTNSEKLKENSVEKGVLLSSGLIAGEGIVGIILAILAVVKVNGISIAEKIALPFTTGQLGGILFFVLLLFVFCFNIRVRKEKYEKK